MPKRASNISIKSEIDSNSNIDIDNDIDIDINGVSDYVSNNDSDSDSTTDSDTGSTANDQLDDDNCINDSYNGGAKETSVFLYRYFTIFFIPNLVFKKLNIIIIKITLFYTKREDNNSRI